jgi:hypothetical protein
MKGDPIMQVRNATTTTPADIIIPIDQAARFAIIKADLDLAWAKIQDGLQQEVEGRKSWIEGTLALINNLDDARKRLGSDQAFGKWLTENG